MDITIKIDEIFYRGIEIEPYEYHMYYDWKSILYTDDIYVNNNLYSNKDILKKLYKTANDKQEIKALSIYKVIKHNKYLLHLSKIIDTYLNNKYIKYKLYKKDSYLLLPIASGNEAKLHLKLNDDEV